MRVQNPLPSESMEKQPEMIGNLQTALELREKGYLPVAILPGLKVPAERWTRWLTEEMTQDSITR